MPDAAFPARNIVAIADIEIRFFDPSPDNLEGSAQSSTYLVQLRMSDGSLEIQSGNLLPHLTNAEINGLKALLLRLRQKANTAWIE